jgi:hypothetical protein
MKTIEQAVGHQYMVGVGRSEGLLAMGFAVQPHKVEQAAVLACARDET